jgi:hypothetical protein
VSRPLSASMLILTALVLIVPMFKQANAWRLKAAG